jgi:predicted RNase H-like HicB family nuclease
MRRFNFLAVIWKEEGGYVSYCPELEVSSCGDSPEEALHNLKEAVELYLENAKELGMLEDVEKIAQISEKFTSSLEVELQ